MKASKKFLIFLYYFFMLGTILSIFLFVIVACNWRYIKGWFNHEQFYSQVEFENKVEEYKLKLQESEASLTIIISERDQLNITVSQLKNDKTTLQNQVQELETQVKNLTNQVNDLTSTDNSNKEEIERLNNEIASKNLTISSLNSTIDTLNTDISSKEETISSLNSQVLSLQNEITRLNGLIAGYEDIKNGTHEVDFYCDETLYVTKVVKNNNCIDLDIDSPTKDGYAFDGWSLDGTNIVDYKTVVITEDTIFKAVFTKLHNVTFVCENITKSTQIIRNGEFAVAPNIESSELKVFNGWKVNNIIQDVSTYAITTDTTFVADITYKYTVEFEVNGSTISSQLVVSGAFASLPTTPEGDFVGWTLNGTDIVDVAATPITANTTFVARFKQWRSIYSNSDGMLVSFLNSSLLNKTFKELKTTSTFRVTYSCIAVQFTALGLSGVHDGYVKSDNNVVSYNFDKGIPSGGLNGVLTNNQLITINPRASGKGTSSFNFKFNCVENGKLNLVIDITTPGSKLLSIKSVDVAITNIEVYE